MIRTIFVLIALVLGSTATAEVFECSFTEPFFTLTYTTQTSNLVYFDSVTGRKTTSTIMFEVVAPGLFEFKDRAGNMVLKLDLNNQGSDGMSDIVYPYDATYYRGRGRTERGGCSSLRLPRRNVSK